MGYEGERNHRFNSIEVHPVDGVGGGCWFTLAHYIRVNIKLFISAQPDLNLID
jgi:hypothetical protein